MSQVAATFKLDYSLLYSALCSTLRDDQTTLLLYLLIHRNIGVKAFIFSRTNIDLLVSASVCLCICLSLCLSLCVCLCVSLSVSLSPFIISLFILHSLFLFYSLFLTLCASSSLSFSLFLSLSINI